MVKNFFFLFSLVILSFFLNAQNAEVVVTDPTPVPDPLEFCIGESITVELQNLNPDMYEGLGAWYKCSEEPDLIGWSNYDLWEYIPHWDLTYTFTLEEEMYIWAQVTDINFGYMTPVLHISVKGTIPELVYIESDTAFCEGSTVNISVLPNDLGTGNYKWFKDDLELAGETSFEYTITEPGVYHVAAKDAGSECPDDFIPSEQIGFEYIFPEVYGDLKIDLNRMTFSTNDIYDTYQWYSGADEMNLTAIPGANAFEFNATITSTDTYYALEVTTGSCTVMSDAYLVNDILYSYPVIIDPGTNFICRDGSVELTVENNVYASYQWYKNGSSIWGATSSTLIVDDGWSTGSGEYLVIVTTVLDETDELESNSINIEVAEKPSIYILDNATFCPGAEITLYTDENFDTYQWLVNDVNNQSTAVVLSGATSSSYTITVLDETRYYYVATTYNTCEDTSSYKNVTQYALNTPYAYTYGWTSEGDMCLGDSIQLRAGGYDVTWQWYLNGELAEGITEQTPYVHEFGNYTVEVSSTLCPNLDPVMSEDTVSVDYTVKPSFSVDPEGQIYNDDPNHLIFCSGEAISMTVDNHNNYDAWQWMGKLFDPGSTTDDWEDIEGEDNYIYSFINGENDKLHFKVRVDSIKDDMSVCSGISDYKTIDGWVFQDPVIASYNTELCEQGDSTLLHLGFPGDWLYFEWYLDGVVIPDSDNDSIYAKEEGMYTLSAYPILCPDIEHSSGLGPIVTFMPEAGISEESDGIYALPASDMYVYQWYYSANNPGSEDYIENMTAVDADTLVHPWVIMYDQMAVGYYALMVSNPFECERISNVFAYGISGNAYLRERSIELYPNPAGDFIRIKYSDSGEISKIEMINLYGEYVKIIDPENIGENISIIDLSNGFYVLRITYQNGQSESIQFIKH